MSFVIKHTNGTYLTRRTMNTDLFGDYMFVNDLSSAHTFSEKKVAKYLIDNKTGYGIRLARKKCTIIEISERKEL